MELRRISITRLYFSTEYDSKLRLDRNHTEYDCKIKRCPYHTLSARQNLVIKVCSDIWLLSQLFAAIYGTLRNRVCSLIWPVRSSLVRLSVYFYFESRRPNTLKIKKSYLERSLLSIDGIFQSQIFSFEFIKSIRFLFEFLFQIFQFLFHFDI